MKDHPEEKGELKIVGLVREVSQLKRKLDEINWGKHSASLNTIMELEEELIKAETLLDKENRENPWRTE